MGCKGPAKRRIIFPLVPNLKLRFEGTIVDVRLSFEDDEDDDDADDAVANDTDDADDACGEMPTKKETSCSPRLQ